MDTRAQGIGLLRNRCAPLAAVVVCAIATAAFGCGADAEQVLPPAVAASATPAAETSRPSVCLLVGQEEMSRILGGAVAPPTSDRPQSTCVYAPASGKGVTPYARVSIDWNGGTQAAAGLGMADRMMSKDTGFSIADRLEGVGDEASMMIGGLITVRRGRMFITIDLRMQPRAKDKGVAIARTILARLDGGAPR